MNREPKRLLMKCSEIYARDRIFSGGIYIENNIIKEILDEDDLKNINYKDIEIYSFRKNYKIIPGIIDLHIHGLMGADTMDGNLDVFNRMSEYLPQEGVTSFLATTITSDDKTTKKTLTLISNFMNRNNFKGATLLGINLEGPFISKEKSGAHNKELVLNPDVGIFEEWQYISGNNINIVTIAPELPGAFDFIQRFRDNVAISLGHTNCSYEVACKAIDYGARLATHLFNAMSGIDHKTPGAALAVLLTENPMLSEIIVDKIHLHEVVVKLIYKLLGKKRIILISDAMRAKGLGTGIYEFGGNKIFVDKLAARLQDGTLAGSLLKMNHAIKNMIDITKASLSDVISMVSENPAKLLNIYNKKGSIDIGKDADMVVLDNNFNVVMTLSMGKIVYISDEKCFNKYF
jgi:N-acetylglucosamine-6-phosphate deacetylase